MNATYTLSVVFNLAILSLVLFLILKGRKLIEAFFVRNVLDKRHQQKLSMFKACPTKTGAIIFLGDSITEGGNWEEMFEDKTILNRGIGGDISEGVLKRLDEVCRHQASKIFICIGTNDLARRVSVKNIISNYKSILERISKESPSTKVYVQSVLPVGEKVLFGHNNSAILLLNQAIEKMCVEEKIPYLNIHPIFADNQGNLKKEFTNDNLHLLGSAYLVWKDFIAAEMHS